MAVAVTARPQDVRPVRNVAAGGYPVKPSSASRTARSPTTAAKPAATAPASTRLQLGSRPAQPRATSPTTAAGSPSRVSKDPVGSPRKVPAAAAGPPAIAPKDAAGSPKKEPATTPGPPPRFTKVSTPPTSMAVGSPTTRASKDPPGSPRKVPAAGAGPTPRAAENTAQPAVQHPAPTKPTSPRGPPLQHPAPVKPTLPLGPPSRFTKDGAGSPKRATAAATGSPASPFAPPKRGPATAAGSPSKGSKESTGSPSKGSKAAARPVIKLDLAQIEAAIKKPEALERIAMTYFKGGDLNQDRRISLEELGPLLQLIHKDMNAALPSDEDEKRALITKRLKKFDLDGDSMLSPAEFLRLFNFILLHQYEELKPAKYHRADSIGGAHMGTPMQFYNIDKQLGSGSFGIVHLVKNKTSNLMCVMKTINKDRAKESGMSISELHQEIQTLVLLDHPHILRLFEWYTDPHNVYLILDICAGGELLDLIKESVDGGFQIPEAWIQRIFLQSLEAISYIHSKGVMHKDLKFENLMLQKKLTRFATPDDIHVVVIDVGLAELFGPKHRKAARSKIGAGTLSTMAPEVLKQDFSFKCDVWSLGCMLYAIFNSEPVRIPDDAGGEDEVYPYPFFPEATKEDPSGITGLFKAQHRGPDMRKVAGASKAAQDLILRMLNPSEAKRPDCKACLKHPWLAEELAGEHALKAIPAAHLNCLLQEHSNQKLFRAAACQAASQLPATKVAELTKVFKSLDVDNDGAVSKAEMVAALVKLGTAQKAAEHAAEMADLDGDGQIEFSEFVATCLPASKELFTVALQAAFQKFDIDGDGSLDLKEVQQLLTGGHVDALYLPGSKSVREIMEELDVDHNGRISFDEFHDYFMTADEC